MTSETDPQDQNEDQADRITSDLDFCLRCGQPIEEIIWGITNCPRCGLHFECC